MHYFPLNSVIKYDTIKSSTVERGDCVARAVIAAFLSILFYLTNLLNGGTPPTPTPVNEAQYSYSILGQTGEILAERAVLRRTPDNHSEIVGTVQQNEPLLILDEREDWYKVRSTPQLVGWLPKYALSLSPVDKKEPGKLVLGYYSGDQAAYESLLSQGTQLTGIVPFGWRLTAEGELVNEFHPERIGRGLYFAGNQELGTYVQLKLPPDAGELKKHSFTAIEAMLKEWGLKGVMIDVDEVPYLTQIQLFASVAELREHLAQKGFSTLIALPWQDELDLPSAAAAADYLILKTLDPTATTPGPPASLAELKSLLPRVTEQVPAEKIILGLANVGLNWSGAGLPAVLSYQQVMELAASNGVDIKWDNLSQTPYFQYGQDSELWFENRYSIKHKLELIAEFDLAGVAFLQLGKEDPDMWNMLAKAL